ncbi:formyltransferase family protein [Roseimaritima ulvae]|uniref:Bifunctional polymyxin resistance protein ArnA n=1 Tax=Roseimaritima ulvae TaxID=980254 RepID=A0A5B9QRX7_9BACT|nr:formyltransferase family protein [Roseimaritima ulvae]QEG40460.1 Bifunctional polymyxin resistance protein ArnA [Roseimaritima ulvae]
MRITILTSYEGISALALKRWLPELQTHELSVFYTRKGKANAPAGLQALADYDVAVLRQNQAVFDDLGAALLNDVNGNGFDAFAATAPDLVLSLRHMSILKKRVIEVPRSGVHNLHSGQLPAYRGVMATFWAMSNGEQQIASTLHWIDDDQIDRGSIVSSESIEVDYAVSYYENLQRLYTVGFRQIVTAVDAIATGTIPSGQPTTGGGAYYTWPTQRQLNDFPIALFPGESKSD